MPPPSFRLFQDSSTRALALTILAPWANALMLAMVPKVG